MLPTVYGSGKRQSSVCVCSLSAPVPRALERCGYAITALCRPLNAIFCRHLLAQGSDLNAPEVMAAIHCLSRMIYSDKVCYVRALTAPSADRGDHHSAIQSILSMGRVRGLCTSTVLSEFVCERLPSLLPLLLVERAYQPFIRYKYDLTSPPFGLLASG